MLPAVTRPATEIRQRSLMGRLAACALCALLVGASGCGEDDPAPAPWLLDPALPMPTWLSAAGIYADRLTLAPADGFVVYEPPHPLYSNRATKQRLLWLPPGTRIAVGPDGWGFPLGAVLVKTFSYRHVEGRFGDVAIETRVIRRAADGWQYGVYHWDEGGDEARLAAPRWPEARFLLEDLNGSDFTYVIPGELDCEACHATHGDPPVIGLGPGNLDPALALDRPELFEAPPAADPLPARSEPERAAMSYIVGNCAHCHHGAPRGDNASFDLRPAALVANTVGVPTESSASGDGIRVVPGDPAGSALYEAVVSARDPGYAGDFKPMPPVGIVDLDREAADILADWIDSLEAE